MVRCGAQRVMLNIINYLLTKNCYDVVLVNDYPLRDDVSQYSVSDCVKRLYLQKHNSRGYIVKNIIRIKKLRGILKQEKPDVSISFLGRTNIRFLIASNHLKTKKIVSVRNDPYYEYGKSFLIKKYVNHLFNRANNVVVQTSDVFDYFPSLGKNKLIIIPNAVDPIFYNTPYLGGENIATFGRLSKQKNHKLLIDSFSMISDKFPKTNMLIFGEGDLRKELNDYIESLGLSKRVYLMGSTDKVQTELSKTKVFILSSDFEGMPNILLESLAVGVPSISTDCPCGGPRTIIRDGHNGFLVKCGDSETLAQRMNDLLSDEMLLLRFHINAKKTAESWSPSIVNSLWENLIVDNKNEN